jgi:hypothetical protein
MTATNSDADESADEVEQTYDPAVDSYGEYYDRIGMIAEGIEETYEEFGDSYGSIHEIIHEDVDGSGLTFKTYQTINVLKYSDTSPRDVPWEMYVDDEDGTAQYTDYLMAWAYTIVERDVIERLQRRDNIDEL